MSLRARVSRLKGGLGTSDDKIVTGMVLVMKEMSWSYHDLLQIPIPAYMIIVEELDKQEKKDKAKMEEKTQRR